MHGEWALVVMSIVLAFVLTYLTKLRRENRRLKYDNETKDITIEYQKQIMDGKKDEQDR